MREIQEWLVYHPPKSTSFGHQSTPRDARKAWVIVEHFLASVTGLELNRHCELTCVAPGEWTDPVIAKARKEQARNAFGPESSGESSARWNIDASLLAKAVQFALDDDKFAKQQMGPSLLSFSYSFLWKEFAQRPYWSGGDETRNGKSHLGLFIGGGALFIQPTLVFPAPWNSQLLKDFLAQTEARLPFRFRDQYFKRSLPAKDGGRGRVLNLPKGWRTMELSAGSSD